ncbi:MAG TPA: hypothetical protein VGH50_16590 [Candidatus Binatia bacterium]|jgi:hypothetical protein
MGKIIRSAVILFFFAVAGCASLGPGTVARDRFDYVSAISDSWKSQMLLNLVKLRYGDAPVFLDVASVINQYAVQGTIGYGGNWAHGAELPWPYNSLYSLSTGASYTDRPTITYSPLSGERFARNLMTPITPMAILNLLQAGYPADLVLRITVHSINGIHSRYGGSARTREADPEFYTLVEKLRQIQQSGDLGMRVRKTGEQTATLIVFSKKPNPEVEASRAEVRKILGLDPNAGEFSVVYGSVASSDKEIAILTRSMLEILIDLSSYIEAPAASVAERRTYPTPPPELVSGAPIVPLIRIPSSAQKPADAFAAVPYRNDWYWIDDKDFPSKRIFSFIMFLFSLTETEGKQGAPVITIPAG